MATLKIQHSCGLHGGFWGPFWWSTLVGPGCPSQECDLHSPFSGLCVTKSWGAPQVKAHSLPTCTLSAFGWRAYEQSNNRKRTEGRNDFKNLQNRLDNCTSPLLCPSSPRGWCGPQAAHRMGLMKAKESWWGGMLKRLRTSTEVCAPALECIDLSRNPGSVP